MTSTVSTAMCSCGESCGCPVGQCQCAKVEHKIKLVYFDGRGLAEVSRLLLAAAHVKYEDVRLKKEGVEELKKTGQLAFNQVPLLDFDGLLVVQSNAINRFLARQFGFYGKTTWDAAQIDQVMEGFNDVRSKFYQIRMMPAGSHQDEAKATFAKDVLPLWLKYLEALLIKNNNGTGFFVGKDITLADIYAFHIIEIFKETYPEVLQHCPTIAQLLDRVSKFPGISEWLAVRP